MIREHYYWHARGLHALTGRLAWELERGMRLELVSLPLLLHSNAFSRNVVRSSSRVFSERRSPMTPSSSSTLVFSSINFVFCRSLKRR